MRMDRFIMRGTALLAVAAPLAFGQATASSSSAPRFLISSSAPVSASTVPNEEIVREIDDPRNGDRWLLMRDDRHPAGPGVLLLVSAVRAPATQFRPEPAPQPPIIHAGDHVIVEENTTVADARLEAVAMGPASAGSPFNVRLSIGGRVVRAIAAGPGRAVLQQEVSR